MKNKLRGEERFVQWLKIVLFSIGGSIFAYLLYAILVELKIIVDLLSI